MCCTSFADINEMPAEFKVAIKCICYPEKRNLSLSPGRVYHGGKGPVFLKKGMYREARDFLKLYELSILRVDSFWTKLHAVRKVG